MADFRPAAVPYNPNADVEPTTQAPNDTLRVQASPQDFGAQIGGAVEKLGAAGERVGGDINDIAIQRAIKINEASVNAAQAGWFDKTNQLLYDPTLGFYAQKGYGAAQAYQPTLDKMNDLRQQTMSSLANPQQKLMYDQLTRRQYDWALQSMGRHADEQFNSALHVDYLGAVEKGGQSAVLAGASGDVGPDSNYGHLVNEIGDMAESWAIRGQGAGQDAAAKERQTRVGDVVRNTVMNLLQNGYVDQAGALLKERQGQMDTLSYQTAFKAYDAKAVSVDASHYVLGSGAVQPQPDGTIKMAPGVQDVAATQSGKPSVDSMLSAFKQQESGGRDIPNAYQIQPATWQQYALPTESINNPTDNQTVARRIVQDLSDKYGGDPQRVATAYFSGPGNVAPMAATQPFAQDKSDANGQTTSRYVSQFMQNLNKAGVDQEKSTLHANLADAQAEAIKRYPNDPTKQRQFTSEVNAIYQVAKNNTTADEAAVKAKNDAAWNDIGKQLGAFNDPADPKARAGLLKLQDQVNNDNSLNPETRDKVNGQIHSRLNELLEGDAKSYGPGFQATVEKINRGEITSEAQVQQLYGPDSNIRWAGIEQLKALVKTPFLAKAVDTALSAGRQHIVYPTDYGSYKLPPDQVGEDLYARQFEPQLLDQLQTKLNDPNNHLTLAQLTTERNPDGSLNKNDIVGPLIDQVSKMRDRDKAEAAAWDSVRHPTWPDVSQIDATDPQARQEATQQIGNAYRAFVIHAQQNGQPLDEQGMKDLDDQAAGLLKHLGGKRKPVPTPDDATVPIMGGGG